MQFAHLLAVQDDYRWVGGIILALIYIAGHIANALKGDKSKQKEQAKPSARPPERTKPTSSTSPGGRADEEFIPVELLDEPPRAIRPEPPARERPAPPRPARPVPTPPRQRSPIARRTDRPRPAPVPRPPQGLGSTPPRPIEPASSSVSDMALHRREVDRIETAERDTAQRVHEAAQAAHISAAGQTVARPVTQGDRLARSLRERGNAQAAIILAEILAPPVTLRDNHLS